MKEGTNAWMTTSVSPAGLGPPQGQKRYLIYLSV